MNHQRVLVSTLPRLLAPSLLVPSLLVLGLLGGGLPCQDLGRTDAADTSAEARREALEQAFEDRMNGCQMVGRFTIAGSDKPAQEETYTISRVSWVTQNKWRFDAKIEYGGRSMTVPVVVEVEWAGDTPMIQLTDKEVPGMGTYSARVLIYRDHYAGWWGGGDHSGAMFGRIQDLPQDSDGDAGADQDPVGQAEAGWTNWRGPGHAAIAVGANVLPPLTWSEDKNVQWKLAVPGLGTSTPVLHGDYIYLSTAIPTDREAPTAAADDDGDQDRGRRGRRGRGRQQPVVVHEYAVLAVDRRDGSIAWTTTVAEEAPHEPGHSDATHASGSPITDGERIYAHFGSRGLHCLDMDGNILWSVDLGKMRTRNGFGEGSSPGLHGDTLVVVWDHEGDSFIVALKAQTGEEIWRNPRDEPTSWATPAFAEVDGRTQVVVAGTTASRGYDLANGEEIWRCTGMTLNAVPSPVVRDGVAYLMSGFRGSMLQAIRLAGAEGDITDTDHVLWSHNRSTSYVPSPLVYDDTLYFLRVNTGVLSCVDPATGEVHYEGQRLEGVRSVYSSPVGAADRVYITSRDGTTKVIARGREFEELASNSLDDNVDASLVIHDDTIYLRGRKSLYCIRDTGKAAGDIR